jgi:type I restriction enzyme S subunit
VARFQADPTVENLEYLFHPSFTVTGAEIREALRGLAVTGRLTSCPPARFLTRTLAELTTKLTDGTHKTPKYVDAGVHFVSVKDFSSGVLSLDRTRFIEQREHDELVKRCDPRRGDILLARIGTLGVPVTVETDIPFSLFVSAALIRPNLTQVSSEYLKLLLASPIATAGFNRIKVGGATHTNKLNLGDLRMLEFPVPPLAEQGRIVAKVNELLALVDQLESQITASEEAGAKLLDALVAELAPSN